MRSTRRIPAVPAALALALAIGLGGVPAEAFGQAQNEVPPRGEGAQARHPEAAEAIDHLWSPYCPGLMLEVCPSGGGAALRDSLQQRAEEGATSEELVAWVLANHGEQYRALPEREGAGLLAWIGPPAAVLIGIAVVVLALQHMMTARREAAPAGLADRELSDDEERRLDEALREMDQEEEAPFF